MSFGSHGGAFRRFAIVLLLHGASWRVQAQETPQADCNKVVLRARGRSPSQLAVGDVAMLAECGDSGREALADLVRGAASETNRDVLMQLVGVVTNYDPVLFAAGADLASNGAATRSARVAGLRILLHQVRRAGSQFVILNRAVHGTVQPEAFVDSASACGIIGGEEGLPVRLSQSVVVAERLSNDADPVVRNVARCIHAKLGPPPEARLTVRDVVLRPLCSLTLLVQTSSTRRVTLDWTVEGTQARGAVSIEPGQATHLSVDLPGQVVLSYLGHELARARTKGSACP